MKIIIFLPVIGVIIFFTAYCLTHTPKMSVLGSTKELEERIIITPSVSRTPTSTPIPSPSPTLFHTLTSTPTPKPKPTATLTPKPTPKLVAASSDLEQLFNQYAIEYNVDAAILKRIAYCESHYNAGAVNKDYAGLFQFTKSAWTTARTQMGHDINPDLRLNANEAIKTAAFLVSKGKLYMWPACAK